MHTSTLHESVLEMFRERPSLAFDLLESGLGFVLPQEGTACLEPNDVSELVTKQYRPDCVAVLRSPTTGAPVLGVVIEVQLRRDSTKKWTWPLYLVHHRNRLRCPTMLLVVCTDDSVAAWSRQPILLGHPDWDLQPLVVGPDVLPVVSQPGEGAGSMQLSVLSALVHADHADRDKALEAFVSALNFIDGDRGSRYYDFVIGALPEQARRQLEEMMSTTTVNPFKSEFARRYFEQGRAQAVLMILDARGIAISDENRARIGETVDHAQLDAWIERAATIEHGEDL